MNKPELPSLENLTAICKSAGSRGWSREQVRDSLERHGARWKAGRLTEVPLHQRAGLLSTLMHHPSWAEDRVVFCARLQAMGCRYAELGAAAEHLGWKRPSLMSREDRRVLMELLVDPESDLCREIWELREARKTRRKAA